MKINRRFWTIFAAVLLVVGVLYAFGLAPESGAVLGVGAVAGVGVKKRVLQATADQIKIFDDLTKPDWADAYRDLYREAKGENPPIDWATDARARRNRLFPEAGKHKATGTGTGGRLSFQFYTALTAVSAHAGGMPLALFERYPDDLRGKLLEKGFVKIGDAPASRAGTDRRAQITVEGNAALDAYEKNVIQKSATANAALAGAPASPPLADPNAPPLPGVAPGGTAAGTAPGHLGAPPESAEPNAPATPDLATTQNNGPTATAPAGELSSIGDA